METFKINGIKYSQNGMRIDYDYSMTKGIQDFFDNKNVFYASYNKDISAVPPSISIIPLLANMAPIAWFAGFNIEVEEVDFDFYHALESIKQAFGDNYPDQTFKGSLISERLKKNHIDSGRSAMLFSGGVDAFATYIRNVERHPDLITVHGADIEISDQRQWDDFLKFNESETTISGNVKKYIECNLRRFYTYKVDLLLPELGWWGKVQHGLGLIGLTAPLSYQEGYSKIYIASSYTDHIHINWGSTPKIDGQITWAGIQVLHDGYELKRQDKIDLITDFAEGLDDDLRLRVCYSELNDKLNCSRCEKCYRTILGIILAGKDPNRYGFEVDKIVYPAIFQKLNKSQLSKGAQYFWWELMEKAKAVQDPFIFSDSEYELNYLNRIRDGEIDNIFEDKIKASQESNKQKYKYVLRNRFPKVYALYQKLKN